MEYLKSDPESAKKMGLSRLVGQGFSSFSANYLPYIIYFKVMHFEKSSNMAKIGKFKKAQVLGNCSTTSCCPSFISVGH